jgi:hypothetical protein
MVLGSGGVLGVSERQISGEGVNFCGVMFTITHWQGQALPLHKRFRCESELIADGWHAPI